MANRGKDKGKTLSGQALKNFRHSVAVLKKKGVVSKRVDARSQAPTKYMQSKVRKFTDVIEGKTAVVKAPKRVREKYASKGLFEERGSFLIVPKDTVKQRQRIRRGEFLEIITPLRNGEESRVILPYNLRDMHELAEYLKTNPDLDGLKQPDEQFGFRFYGHNSIGYPDAESLIEDILIRYAARFTGKASEEAFQHLQLVRFKTVMRELPDEEKLYSPRGSRWGRPDATGRSMTRGTYERQKKERQAKRQADYRARMSPEEYAAYLEKQKERARQYRSNKKKG